MPTASRRRTAQSRFVAIDFETADHGRDSACAIGLVLVEGTRVVREHRALIRPPRHTITFTSVHGIAWRHVAREPTFAQQWAGLSAFVEGAEFFAAHNASFDRGVLAACCLAAGVAVPAIPFRCTVQLARAVWSVYPTKLPNVCAHLGIELDHHDALSDARACARIVIEARRIGASA
ncbi:MAG: 3'-5' exonuclease [Polyangiales bacterium]